MVENSAISKHSKPIGIIINGKNIVENPTMPTPMKKTAPTYAGPRQPTVVVLSQFSSYAVFAISILLLVIIPPNSRYSKIRKKICFCGYSMRLKVAVYQKKFF
jgi:hypothetical protein